MSTVIRTIEGKEITLSNGTMSKVNWSVFFLIIVISFVLSVLLITIMGGLQIGQTDASCFFVILGGGCFFTAIGLVIGLASELILIKVESFYICGDGAESEVVEKTENESIDTAKVCSAANKVELQMKEYALKQKEKEEECERIARRCK